MEQLDEETLKREISKYAADKIVEALKRYSIKDVKKIECCLEIDNEGLVSKINVTKR